MHLRSGIIEVTPPFSLHMTLGCGQVFRWSRAGEWYTGIIGDDHWRVRESEHGSDGTVLEYRTTFEGDSERFLRQYLRLGDDLPRIYENIARDPVVEAAVRYCHGLRLIKQEPWECMASFICAQCANIPRIRRIIERVAQTYGPRHMVDGETYHGFPGPEALAAATPGALRGCGLGYRAEYMHALASAVVMGELQIEALSRADTAYEALRAELMMCRGVGAKVADCIALFGFGKLEAFPLDTWLRRVITEIYFGGERVPDRQLREFGRRYFGVYAGYAQQYLFHHARMGAERGECLG